MRYITYPSVMSIPRHRDRLQSQENLCVLLLGGRAAPIVAKGPGPRNGIAPGRWDRVRAAAKGCEVGEITLDLPAKLKARGTAVEVAAIRSNLSAKRQAGNGAVENISVRRDSRAQGPGSQLPAIPPVRPREIWIGASSVLTTPSTSSAPWVACGWRGVLPGRAAAATAFPSPLLGCARPKGGTVGRAHLHAPVAPLGRPHPGKSATVMRAHLHAQERRCP